MDCHLNCHGELSLLLYGAPLALAIAFRHARALRARVVAWFRGRT